MTQIDSGYQGTAQNRLQYVSGYDARLQRIRMMLTAAGLSALGMVGITAILLSLVM
ncbi:hypothetical protein [uncultured Devosia sp.]|uniref:hypothetical protein n=1 Tax=uncultured Devosia sp. TaxID=211434 RepID=UPI0026023BA3|nr:hypothetical protein [uncultured Devosia sp.]